MTFDEAIKAVQAATNKNDALRLTYDILTAKYRGYRVKTYLRFWELGGGYPDSLEPQRIFALHKFK